MSAVAGHPPEAVLDATLNTAHPRLRALLGEPGSTAILVDASRDPNSGVVVLLIPPGGAAPRLAVKIATTEAAARVLAAEARMLVALGRLPLPRTGPTLPRHEATIDADGMLAIAATVVPGTPMSTGYHAFRHSSRPALVRADFAAAADWLAGLHADSMGALAPIALLDGAADRIGARWPGDAQAEALARLLPAMHARLAAVAVPRTIVHGDFWAGNLLVSDGRVSGAVDWAAGVLSGEPLRDVARFALSYSLYLDRHTRPGRPVPGHQDLRASGWGAGIRYAAAGQHWFGEAVRDFIAGALARLGAPTALWRDVLLAGLADVAVAADHPEFAAQHRDLLLQLLGEEQR
jgi:aminoglycoside phosphotransferase (APT) family kinase protein